MNKQIILNECWARDGLQNQDKFIETEQKLQMIKQLVKVGFTRIEATSFSHPKHTPQFKDAEKLLSMLPSNLKNVSFKATCVNEKALLRAIDAKNNGYPVNEVSFVMAASEAYNKINVKMNNDQLLAVIGNNIDLAKTAAFDSVLISISTAFGCEYQEDIQAKSIYKLLDYFIEKGVNRFSISDTMGVANPDQVNTLFESLLHLYPEVTFIAHFHDTKGWGIANCYAALQAGITHFDVSLGGIGGPPATRMKDRTKATGNVCTEDFVLLLEALGYETNINVDEMMKAGRFSEELLGTQRSNTLIR